MDFLAFGLSGDQCTQEGDELGAGVVLSGLAHDLAGGSVQSGVEGKGPVRMYSKS